MSAKINRALISVSDKTGIVEFARQLVSLNVEIISTGGTATTLKAAGISVRDVSEVTGFPEMLSGRVKTLHPLIHGGILAIRSDSQHRRQVEESRIPLIDMVVVNLYPFRSTVARPDVTAEDAIENIDIGGPTMIRAAAKNFFDVAVVVDPADYDTIAGEMKGSVGSVSARTRMDLARKAFAHTAEYDSAIAFFLANRFDLLDGDTATIAPPPTMPRRLTLTLEQAQSLRYGENPHQSAGLYRIKGESGGVASARQLQGKELSFNNFLDLEAAWNLVSEFSSPACVIIKHTNPCGAAVAESVAEAYKKALATDPLSAFGGIIGFNRPVMGEAAQAIGDLFVEAIIAPAYEEEALSFLSKKKNLRVMLIEASRAESGEATTDYDLKRITGGVLIQTRDMITADPATLKVVTKRAPTEDETEALLFAWVICKHVKSNAIVYARRDQLVGVGSGQTSRVDSVKFGAMKAVLPLEGTSLASDAFFPFRDGIDEAARHGVRAIIQPGGSVRDAEVIAAADEHGLAMLFTGVRHFKH
jgi:phosphoribosylaminoimidazolecarboxamide formyltransferase/IMP cyclohydrolase